jgi:hypothetical protein
MKRFALAGAVLMLAPWAVAEEAGFGPEAAARSVVIRAQSLIDGVSGAPRSHVDILIRGNRIVEVAPAGAHLLPPGAFADLIAVAGNPLADVNVLKSVQFVMKDGAVFKSPANAAPAP